jgi:hypothetical protein
MRGWKDFGDRSSGRFPRISATVHGDGSVYVRYCPNRHAYNTGSGMMQFIISARDARVFLAMFRKVAPLATRATATARSAKGRGRWPGHEKKLA